MLYFPTKRMPNKREKEDPVLLNVIIELFQACEAHREGHPVLPVSQVVVVKPEVPPGSVMDVVHAHRVEGGVSRDIEVHCIGMKKSWVRVEKE